MKNPVVILSAGFLSAVLVLVGVFYCFGVTADNTQSHEVLAAFGSYMGGVLTPLTVLVALIALIHRQKAHNAEMERLVSQSHKADLLRFIEKIEDDIDSTLSQLSITVQVPGDRVRHPASDALFKLTMQEWEKVIPSESEIMERVESVDEGLPRYDEQVLSFEIFGMVAAYIKRLREHCHEYDRAAKNNITTIYFARKYKLATRRLSAKGYPIDIWDPSAQQEYASDAL